jgi:hypothetical protein
MDILLLEHVYLPQIGTLAGYTGRSRYGSWYYCCTASGILYGWRRQIKPLADAGLRGGYQTNEGTTLVINPGNVAAYG